MSDRDRGDDSYTGRAGQQAFVAQVLLRFGNAAVPVVDVGTDVVVFADDLDLSARVQVKTAVLRRYASGGGYSAQFSLPLKQLEQADSPPLIYALVVRDDEANTFPEFVIISRDDLFRHWEGVRRFGTLDKKNRAAVFTLRFHPRVVLGVVCGEVELTEHRAAWHLLPPLARPSDQAAASGRELNSAGGV